MAEEELRPVRVDVVLCLGPREVREWSLELAAGATAQDALHACGVALNPAHAEVGAAPVSVGVWGRAVGLDTVLSEGDRLEIYRGLKVDPKTARRERFARQGARTTGLFARQRPGAKQGY